MGIFIKKATAGFCAVGILLLAGCAQLQSIVEPDAPKRAQVAAAAPEAVYDPAGGAAGNEAYFARIAKEYAESNAEFTGVALVNKFAEAGFDKANMQVSFDKTKINLDADALFLAVRFQSECLIAQIGRAKRDYVTFRAPTVGGSQMRCLIGDTRKIDW